MLQATVEFSGPRDSWISSGDVAAILGNDLVRLPGSGEWCKCVAVAAMKHKDAAINLRVAMRLLGWWWRALEVAWFVFKSDFLDEYAVKVCSLHV
jgi:hypothetical protein